MVNHWRSRKLAARIDGNISGIDWSACCPSDIGGVAARTIFPEPRAIPNPYF
jgi:hypothetical protein